MGNIYTREQAEAYGKQLERLLAQGIVPVSLLERSKADQEIWTLSRCIAEYIRNNSVPVSDIKLLDTVRPVYPLSEQVNAITTGRKAGSAR